MPVYNASEFLYASIDSILSQSYKNIELIIINDGSTDNSEEIINSFKDERVKYFFQKNKGQAAASNFGLSKVGGEYIKFFDADDLMNQEHIEAQLKKLNRSTTSIASCAWGRFYDGDPSSTVIQKETVWQDLKPLDWLKNALQQESDMMAAWLWLIPKNIMDKTGGWDERLTLNNDFEFGTRLLLNADNILFTCDAKVYYRSGVPGSLSLKISERAFKNAYLSTNLGCSYLLKAENSAHMKMLCANRYQQWVYRIYPNYTELRRKFEEQVKILGGSNMKPEGGNMLQTLSTIIGWKTAKKIKFSIHKLLDAQSNADDEIKIADGLDSPDEITHSPGKLRIIHCLNHFLPRQVAGTEIYVWALCKQLQLLDCDVSVLTPNYHSYVSDAYVYDGIPVFSYGEPSVIDRELITGKKIAEGLINFSDYLKKIKPDVIHFHEIAGSNGIGVPHFEAAKSTGARVVFTVHLSNITCSTGTLMYENRTTCDGLIIEARCAYCALVRKTESISKAKLLSTVSKPLRMMDIDTSNWQNPLGTALSYPFLVKRLKSDLEKIAAACDMIIPITKWYQNILIKNGIPKQKLKVIAQALPQLPGNDDFNFKKRNVTFKGPLKLIFIGRIDELKGISLLLNTAKEFQSDELMLDIYGSTSNEVYMNDCKKLTASASHINWRGRIEQENVLSVLKLYDALILPSMFSEMSPLVIQEAFAAGIPVIGSNVYGIAEQVEDGVNGFLFDFGSKESLSSVLKKIIKDRTLLSSFSFNIKPPRGFSDVADETLNVYRHILQNVEYISDSYQKQLR